MKTATRSGRFGVGWFSGAGVHCGSNGLPCDITSIASRASRTLRVSGRCADIIWLATTRCGALALYEGTRPGVVRRPTTPQAQAGWRIEPP